ncbi:hypothetical protein RvY_01093 [Ramazzottius varieornatus]|uniref:Uncharacterized protein n=1 Tax=Ramazzottius varieornatus TaxID=947166 RepID=A0A1D1UF36_RAMVA|nr:hypothetical protein RvY_01093 [Ramazzottius varieornatus]
MDEVLPLSFDSGSENWNKSVPTSTSLNVSTLDASSIYYTYTALGRRLLFRPMFRAAYKDAEDYYRQSYDPSVGIRVAVVLGGLMVFTIGIAVYNRYGLFRKRRKLNVSLGNSQEELEGVEWLQKMHLIRKANATPEYSPKHSDQDFPMSYNYMPMMAPPVQSSTPEPSMDFRVTPLPQDLSLGHSISVDVIPSDISGLTVYIPAAVLTRSNSY